MIKIELKKKMVLALFSAAVLSVNLAGAGNVVYKTEFKKLKPGVEFFKISKKKLADTRKRKHLFPDGKTDIDVGLKPKNDDFTKKFDAVGTKSGALKITPKSASSYPLKSKGELILRIPRIKNSAVVEFRVKFENCFDLKAENSFFVYAAGANLWFRGDRKELRVYDTAKEKYMSVLSINNGDIYDVKVDLRFGEENLYDLTVNGKKILTSGKLRGHSNSLKIVRLVTNVAQATAETPAPTVYLKSLKVEK